MVGNEQETRDFVEHFVKIWLNAVYLQGERCFKALKKAQDSPTKWITDFEQFPRAWDQMLIEEHFFVTAIGKVMHWLKVLKRLNPGLQKPIDEYLGKFPLARDVRNMRQHDIDYLGLNPPRKSDKQGDFVYHHKDETGQVDFSADASSTVISKKNGYLIGGRLNVEEVIQASRELYDLLFPPV